MLVRCEQIEDDVTWNSILAKKEDDPCDDHRHGFTLVARLCHISGTGITTIEESTPDKHAI